MNHTQARQALLVRAFEAPLSPPWTEADRDWADRETVRAEGAEAAAQALIARRGALATERLASSEPAVHTALSLTASVGWAGWLVPMAFVFGLAMDALGPQRRINLFALPLLGMLAWNALVYLGLLAHALSVLMRRQQPVVAHGPLRLALSRWSAALGRALQRLSGPPLSPVLLRFMASWWAVSRSMQMARLAALLHLAAAALAAGALVSMYSRGVFFDFRAGWESTFFDAEAMHRAISWLLGPASRASGVALPGLAEFAALRFPDSGGESAGRWIHLFAITVAGAVLLPRLLLAASAGWQARRLARRFPLALDDAYFSRLVRGLRGDIVEAQVLPYSYQVAPALHPGVQQVLHSRLGATVHLQWLATVPLGGEDDLDAHLAQPLVTSLLVALFSLTATPEREVHATFLRLLAPRLAGGAELMVLIDESAFRQRFAGGDGELRLQQRREAWRQLLREIDLTPVFADLSVQEETS